MSILRRLTGYRTRMNYWGSSKPVVWLEDRLTPKITHIRTAATISEWAEYHKQYEETYPFRNWFFSDFINGVQDFFNLPIDIYKNCRGYLRNRFIDQSHCLRSRLKKGSWWDKSTVVLHALMDSFCYDFLEKEVASQARLYFGDSPEEAARKKTLTDREVVLEHLNWEIAKTKGSQRSSAKVKLELYTWWTETRPSRPDPMDVSGLTEYYAKRASTNSSFWSQLASDESELESKERKAKWLEMSKACSKLENDYHKEDTKMLKKLIDIRESLWT